MMLQRAWKPDDASQVLGLMQTWAARKPSTSKQQAMLALASTKLGVSLSASPPNPQPEGLSAADRADAMRLVLVMACLQGALDDDDLRALGALNTQLGQKIPWPRILRHARDGHSTLATMAMGRLAPDGRALLRAVWRDEGVFGVLRAMRSAQGKGPSNPSIAARYDALGTLPADTLGFAFQAHMRNRKLPMPGERGSLPERAMHHDLMHVVMGCDTDARGEGRLAGIYAGMTSAHPIAGADPFTFVMVALMTFHLGYKVGPTFVGTELGVLDPTELVALIEVGSRIPINVITDWKFQDDFGRPLTEVRRSFGIDPRGALAMVPSIG